VFGCSSILFLFSEIMSVIVSTNCRKCNSSKDFLFEGETLIGFEESKLDKECDKCNSESLVVINVKEETKNITNVRARVQETVLAQSKEKKQAYEEELENERKDWENKEKQERKDARSIIFTKFIFGVIIIFLIALVISFFNTSNNKGCSIGNEYCYEQYGDR